MECIVMYNVHIHVVDRKCNTFIFFLILHYFSNKISLNKSVVKKNVE